MYMRLPLRRQAVLQLLQLEQLSKKTLSSLIQNLFGFLELSELMGNRRCLVTWFLKEFLSSRRLVVFR
jgi:hypothetical protein